MSSNVTDIRVTSQLVPACALRPPAFPAHTPRDSSPTHKLVSICVANCLACRHVSATRSVAYTPACMPACVQTRGAGRNGIANGPYFLPTHCPPEGVRLRLLCRLAHNGWQDTNKPASLDCTVALLAGSSQPAAHIALTFCVDRLRHPSHQLFVVLQGLI